MMSAEREDWRDLQKHTRMYKKADHYYVTACRRICFVILVFAIVDCVLIYVFGNNSLVYAYQFVLFVQALFRFYRIRYLWFDPKDHIGVLEMYWYRQGKDSCTPHNLSAMKKFSLITQNKKTVMYHVLTCLQIIFVAGLLFVVFVASVCLDATPLGESLLFYPWVLVGFLIEYQAMRSFYSYAVVGSVHKVMPHISDQRMYAMHSANELVNKAIAERNAMILKSRSGKKALMF